MIKPKILHDSPEAAEQAFYDALERADLESFMTIWSDDDDIVCIPPGGPRLVGHHKIREVWREILANGPIHVRPSEVSAMQAAMVSVHNLTVQLIVSSEGPTRIVAMDVTNVFFKGPHGWRLILHHSSVTSEEPGNDAEDHGPNSGVLH